MILRGMCLSMVIITQGNPRKGNKNRPAIFSHYDFPHIISRLRSLFFIQTNLLYGCACKKSPPFSPKDGSHDFSKCLTISGASAAVGNLVATLKPGCS